jgi:RimJ/RimL family protein N-acetyltransferase
MLIELRSCALVALGKQNIEDLHSFILVNKSYYQQTISSLEIELSILKFQEQIEKFFNNDRVIQFIVYKHYNVVGTIFLYRSKEGIRISIFFDKIVQNTYIPFEAILSTIDFGIREYILDEIFFSVYTGNSKMLNIAKKINAELLSKNKSEVDSNREVYTYKLSGSNLKSWIQRYNKFIYK